MAKGILAGLGYAVLGTVLLVLAASQQGPARYAIGAVGIVLAAVGAWCLGFWLIIGVAWGYIANFQDEPSPGQWIMWAIGALALGSVLGLTTYGVGPYVLIVMPLLFVALAAAIRSTPRRAARVTHPRRLLAWGGLACLAAIGAGATIFLG